MGEVVDLRFLKEKYSVLFLANDCLNINEVLFFVVQTVENDYIK